MRISILLFTLLFSCSVYAFQSNKKGDWLNNYTGDIDGKYKIGMTLIYHGDKVNGLYFYNKYLKDIKLLGKIFNRNQIIFNEYDNQGNITAVFKGRFIEYAYQDPRKQFGDSDSSLDMEIIVGTWEKIADKKKMPFYLSLSNATYRFKGEGRYGVSAKDDLIIEQSAQTFCQLVKSNNKVKVSKLISYPIDVNLNGKNRRIKDRDEFIKNYDKIFTSSFKLKIKHGIPHNMFTKYLRAMLGNGEIWFGPKGKVVEINN